MLDRYIGRGVLSIQKFSDALHRGCCGSRLPPLEFNEALPDGCHSSTSARQLLNASDDTVRAAAWDKLIAGHTRLLLSVARSFGAGHDDAMDFPYSLPLAGGLEPRIRARAPDLRQPSRVRAVLVLQSGERLRRELPA
jgi:hypothetical protein